jgi:hypothetical protein
MIHTEQADSLLATALLQIAKIRYEAFRERFGREPEPNEPLLFDPRADQPVAADSTDRTLQVLSAALLINVDSKLVLDYLGLNGLH